ncbi:unnamed protein product [Microthlaspi erraticum]|uniref:Uncharacterized protein n=1 Tax=Microthlaspi erraticum TaxID=1685480 RepID=A0A6D2LAC3_9BRAS|nr:unnamed protein product [Microthlaspi erraticum]CAA7062311.1 unnamed protein product [Microthlaspi erraticum]
MAAGDDTTPTETPTVTVAQLEALTAQMKQNEERLAQIQAENATLRAENASLVQARNRYRAPVPSYAIVRHSTTYGCNRSSPRNRSYRRCAR